MTDALTSVTLTDDQRTAFLAAIEADKTLGNVAALRLIGVEGHKRDLKPLIDDELEEQARLARGWNVRKVEDTIWSVALNTEHPSWERAAARIVKAYGGAQFRDQTTVEHTGSVDVDSPDLAAAIDRFTALADAAVRAAARGRAEPTLAHALAAGDGGVGVRVDEVDRPA